MKTLMTVCLGALVAMPAVASAQTATTTTTETPAQTMPAPATQTPAVTTETPSAPAVTTETPAAPAVTIETPVAPAATATTTGADTGMMQPDPVEYVTTESAGSIYVSDLLGQSVYGTATEEKTGDINDLLMDEQGNVTAVIIGVGGFIGLGEKDVAVTLESLTIRTENQEVRISIDATEQELEEAPVFNRADGTSSDRLGTFERAYNRTATEASKAIDEASRRANELYEKGKKAVNELTTEKDDTIAPAPATAN